LQLKTKLLPEITMKIATERLRKEIFAKISKFYQREDKSAFIAGKTFINYAGRCFDKKEVINLVDASLDFWLTEGRFTLSFERNLSKLLSVKHALFVNSGSSANLVAISSLTSSKLKKRRLNPQDEVITTACCFPTTVAPIVQNNLLPVFVDVDTGSYNIKTENLERAVGKKTRAIFIAHAFGNPCDMDRIVKFAQRHNLWLIEDNCDALGAKYNGRYTGTFGDLATLSFYPAHHITTGEGGAVLTNNILLNRIAASFRDWGRDCWCKTGKDNTCGKRFSFSYGSLPYGYDHKYVYSHIGYNLKATDLQAAIGLAQLDKLKYFIAKRQENFKLLYRYLEEFREYLILPEWSRESEPSWFCFPVTLKEKCGFSRNELTSFLESKKIQTRLIFAGNILRQPAFKNIKFRISGTLKDTDRIMNNSFFIGLYPKIGKEEMAYIAGVFKKFFTQRRLNR